MILFDNINNINVISSIIFTSCIGYIGYSLIIKPLYYNYYYKDIGVQTDAWEDFSDRPSQILQTSPIQDDTQTPVFSPVEFINTGIQANSNTLETGIQTEIESTTTVLPIPPIDIPMVPNLELITKVNQGVQTISNPMYGKDWNTIIEYINNKPSFFFDAPGCDTWIIPDPSVLALISNSHFWPSIF